MKLLLVLVEIVPYSNASLDVQSPQKLPSRRAYRPTMSSLQDAQVVVLEEVERVDSSTPSVNDLPGHILATTASYFRLHDLRSFECLSRSLLMRAHDDDTVMWHATRASVRENERRQRVERNERLMYGCPIHCMERNKVATLHRQSRALQRDLVYYKLI